jgi:hypothetical protein
LVVRDGTLVEDGVLLGEAESAVVSELFNGSKRDSLRVIVDDLFWCK